MLCVKYRIDRIGFLKNFSKLGVKRKKDIDNHNGFIETKIIYSHE